MTEAEVSRLERLETIVEEQRAQIERLFAELTRLAAALEQLEDDQDAADAAAALADPENAETVTWEELKAEVGL